MTDTPRSLTLPIPCPRCDHILTAPECDCGFLLDRPPIPPPRARMICEGDPVLL
jgi:hypothetical protein